MMEKKRWVLILLICVLGVFSAMVFYYNYYLTEVTLIPMEMEVDVTVLPMEIEVIKEHKISFNVNPDGIFFGKSSPPSISTRNIEIANNYQYSSIFTIEVEGNISEFISLSDNNFLLDPGEHRMVTYFANTKTDTSEGKYYGETRIIARPDYFTNLDLSNKKGYPLIFTIKVYGNISKFISVSNNNFILDPGEEKSIRLYVKTPIDTAPSKYSGEARIVSKRLIFS